MLGQVNLTADGTEKQALLALAQLLMASDWGPVRGESFNGPIWSVSAVWYWLIPNCRSKSCKASR